MCTRLRKDAGHLAAQRHVAEPPASPAQRQMISDIPNESAMDKDHRPKAVGRRVSGKRALFRIINAQCASARSYGGVGSLRPTALVRLKTDRTTSAHPVANVGECR